MNNHMLLNIHSSIMEKLEYFHKIHKIPNIIFHGPSGGGKKTIVENFINMIYENDKERIKSFVMYVNCAHGKGIKFIREELKFFAKTHINSNSGNIFKSIILLNADKLTTDAQSALRRCIELFTHNTRFFIIIEDKYKLLKPILSRFCEIYVNEPMYNGNIINLYDYNLNQTFKIKNILQQRNEWLKKDIEKILKKDITYDSLILYSKKIYDKGYSGLDFIKLIEKYNITKLEEKNLYKLLFTFHKIKKEFRNEKLIILFILNALFMDKNINL